MFFFCFFCFCFFFNDTATTEIYTLSLHDALPIFLQCDVPVEEIDNIQLEGFHFLKPNIIDLGGKGREIGRAHV